MSMNFENEEPKNQSNSSSMNQISSSSASSSSSEPEPAMSNWLSWFSFNGKCSPIPVAISILISTGFLCVMVFKSRKEKSRPRILTRSASIGLLHGGKLAIQRLLDSHIALANMATLNEAEDELQILIEQEKHDFRKLQCAIAKLEMSAKEAQAIDKLDKAIKKAKEQGKHHEAYELEMLVVEMLIYQGKHIKAMGYKCMNDEDISDARRPLYKAIIYILEGKNDEAKTFWEKFQETREDYKSLYCVEGPINEVANNFDKFKEVANSLKKEIRKALDHNKKK